MLVISGVVPASRRGLGEIHDLPDQQGLLSKVTAFSHSVTDPAELPDVLGRAFDVFASRRPRARARRDRARRPAARRAETPGRARCRRPPGPPRRRRRRRSTRRPGACAAAARRSSCSAAARPTRATPPWRSPGASARTDRPDHQRPRRDRPRRPAVPGLGAELRAGRRGAPRGRRGAARRRRALRARAVGPERAAGAARRHPRRHRSRASSTSATPPSSGCWATPAPRSASSHACCLDARRAATWSRAPRRGSPTCAGASSGRRASRTSSTSSPPWTPRSRPTGSSPPTRRSPRTPRTTACRCTAGARGSCRSATAVSAARCRWRSARSSPRRTGRSPRWPATAGSCSACRSSPRRATWRSPLPIVVYDNSGYGEIRDAMDESGIPNLGTDITTHDLPAIARGFGVGGVRVTDGGGPPGGGRRRARRGRARRSSSCGRRRDVAIGSRRNRSPMYGR